MPYARVIEIIRERIDAAKAAIRASAAHGQAPAGATKPTEQQILEAAEKAGLWPNTVNSWIPAFHRYHKELAKAQSAQAQADSVTAVATLHQIMAAAMELHAIDNPDGEPEWAALRQCEVDVWRDRAEQVLKAAAAHGQAPAQPVTWPTMPPSLGQSPVLFEDGYAEGWAKCLQSIQDLFASTPSPQAAQQAPQVIRATNGAEYRLSADGNSYIRADNVLDGQAPAETGNSVSAKADSVLEDAARESEYQRGYRHGYEQRDAEVRGALA